MIALHGNHKQIRSPAFILSGSRAHVVVMFVDPRVAGAVARPGAELARIIAGEYYPIAEWVRP